MTDSKLNPEDVAAAWNRNAERWSEDLQAGRDVFREHYTLPAFIDFMPAIEGRRVIDLGCGEGRNTRRFARLGGRLTGIDLSEALIARAKAEEARAPLGIRYQVGSYCDMQDIAAESFDVALSTMALMDGPDLDRAFGEAHRVLVSGGRLCFSVLHPCFMTRGFSWLHSKDRRYDGLRVADYFDTTPFVERWGFGNPGGEAPPFEVPRFPRTLSDYLNGVCRAGFRIEAVGEPRVDSAAAAAFPALAHWRRHAPLAFFATAAKG